MQIEINLFTKLNETSQVAWTYRKLKQYQQTSVTQTINQMKKRLMIPTKIPYWERKRFNGGKKLEV